MNELTLSIQLRTAIQLTGESQAAIARGAGVSQSTLSRFMRGRRPMSPAAVDKVVAFLDLRLVSASEWEKRDEVWRAYQLAYQKALEERRVRALTEQNG